MGYGSRALKALNSFYSGEYFNLDETPKPEMHYPNPSEIDPVRYSSKFSFYFFLIITYLLCFFLLTQNADLLTETPTVRSATQMPPLLQRLTERKPENLDYLGVSYGLTPQLLR